MKKISNKNVYVWNISHLQVAPIERKLMFIHQRMGLQTYILPCVSAGLTLWQKRHMPGAPRSLPKKKKKTPGLRKCGARKRDAQENVGAQKTRSQKARGPRECEVPENAVPGSAGPQKTRGSRKRGARMRGATENAVPETTRPHKAVL